METSSRFALLTLEHTQSNETVIAHKISTVLSQSFTLQHCTRYFRVSYSVFVRSVFLLLWIGSTNSKAGQRFYFCFAFFLSCSAINEHMLTLRLLPNETNDQQNRIQLCVLWVFFFFLLSVDLLWSLWRPIHKCLTCWAVCPCAGTYASTLARRVRIFARLTNTHAHITIHTK